MTRCTPGRANAAASVDRADTAMRNGAAQDRGVQQPVARQIVEIDPLAAQKAQILDPLDRAADIAVGDRHRTPPIGGAGFEHGRDDRDIAGAAAEIARQHLAYAGLVAIGLGAEQRMRGGDHPRRAEAALQRVMLAKRGLQGRQRRHRR